MSDPGGDGVPRWLSEREMAAWLPLVAVLALLPQALDKQLREDAGISHVYYQILAVLSAAPGRALRMSELAGRTGTSMSRLSHAVASLERRGWVERAPCPNDRRGQLARLTGAGQQVLVETAPGHVEEVRRLVFDRLSPEDVDRLRALMTALQDGLGAGPLGGR